MLTQVRKKIMEISLLTDIGQKRSNNQDFVNKFVNKAGVTLVIVADGMGGHRAGNIASEKVVFGSSAIVLWWDRLLIQITFVT